MQQPGLGFECFRLDFRLLGSSFFFFCFVVFRVSGIGGFRDFGGV